MPFEASDVSSSISSIIAAFTSCRDVLRKIRSRRHRKAGQKHPTLGKDELSLNHSLRIGSQEIEADYGAGLKVVGQPFQVGDAYARSELTSISLRLNVGLVDIISSFLRTKDPSRLNLDYRALTTLSDFSRIQARDTLRALAQRLSIGGSLHMRAMSLTSGQIKDVAARTKANNKSHKPSYKRHKSIPEGEYIAISKRKNETQIAFVRPRLGNKRKISTESTKSGQEAAAAKAKARDRPEQLRATSGPFSPPAAVKVAQMEPQKRTPSGSSDRHSPVVHDAKCPLQTRHQPAQQQGSSHPCTAPVHRPTGQQPLPCQTHPPDTPAFDGQAIGRRNAAANTNTMYTYASDSTKLGEIPMHHWTIPFDFEEAGRLNAQAETASWVAMQQAAKTKKAPGLFKRLFRRQPLQTVAEA